jgi:phosphatidylethanolamine/phosphatidyl-N-methylethanolamine N-methyltransferase
MKNRLLFAKRFFSSPQTVGSLWPSSERLASCMVDSILPSSEKAVRYLEVGAGSGALTSRLILKLRNHDTLDIVEKDPNFCKLLRTKFSHLSHVTIHELSILDFTTEPYDVLISSLPLNAFSAPLVERILKQYENLVKKGGSLTYFEYIAIEKIKYILLFGAKAHDFREGQELKHRFVTQYGKAVDVIWWNVPPARVIHCQLS